VSQPSSSTDRVPGYGLASITHYFVEIAARERVFLAMLGIAFFVVGATYENAAIARWIGFLFAGYSAVANDSIQTIGTFMESNRNQRWWLLWLFIGGLFLLTVGYSWVVYDGDVTHQRLASKGFAQTPMDFSFLQVAAPLFLLILTRMRMPVSTTFLLLSGFAGSAASVGSVLVKSISGYVVAFVAAMVVWMALSRVFQRWFQGEAHPAWRIFQWITSGFLWSVWVMQDAANVAVYLPRSMSLLQFGGFAGSIFLGLGVLFYMRGDRVQSVVTEKAHVVDVRMATVIDLVYAAVLYYFKIVSKVPMSTTWVFIGLLGGRELAMSLRSASGRDWRSALRLLRKDLLFVTIGLVVSLALAIAVNEEFRSDVAAMLGL
jgi:phosphate/sulfate permease